VARPVTLGAAALRFQGGRLTDLLERDRDPLPLLGGTGIAIPLQASGVTAVRLTGISLAAG